MYPTLKRMVIWLVTRIWDRVNIIKTGRELAQMGRKHGVRFLWAAIAWEVVEDGVLPGICWLAGFPEAFPLFWAIHLEPIAYPIIFAGFRLWDSYRGMA